MRKNTLKDKAHRNRKLSCKYNAKKNYRATYFFLMHYHAIANEFTIIFYERKDEKGGY